jgi:hypothetical protein
VVTVADSVSSWFSQAPGAVIRAGTAERDRDRIGTNGARDITGSRREQPHGGIENPILDGTCHTSPGHTGPGIRPERTL